MADVFSPAKRSEVMQKITSKDTGPEMRIRRALHKLGFRYKLHDKSLPGKPDIVLPKYKTAIQVRGCFWHQHADCEAGRLPKSNLEYWRPKLERNVSRDAQKDEALKAMGWRVIVIWECEIKTTTDLQNITAQIREEVHDQID